MLLRPRMWGAGELAAGRVPLPRTGPTCPRGPRTGPAEPQEGFSGRRLVHSVRGERCRELGRSGSTLGIAPGGTVDPHAVFFSGAGLLPDAERRLAAEKGRRTKARWGPPPSGLVQGCGSLTLGPGPRPPPGTAWSCWALPLPADTPGDLGPQMALHHWGPIALQGGS